MTTIAPAPSAVQPSCDTQLDAVTGAFSYSGAAIASRLLASGRKVRTLTGHPERASRHPDWLIGESAVEVRPLAFDDLPALAASLEGVTTLYNTYWVRFAHGRVDHSLAVENSRTLFQAARWAGVQKIVHVSILHPAVSSPLPYFRGKALVERSLVESGVRFACLRPCVLFDDEGVLLNNIAWLLRTLPVFAIGGSGRYRIRPIHTADLAALACEASRWTEDRIVDAVGPDRPTFDELVGLLRSAVGSRSRIVHMPGSVVVPTSRLLGVLLRDVLLTRDEYRAMSGGLADSDAPSTGAISLSEWISANGERLGLRYRNELELHFRR
jgi:NADH dehydrogenase